MTRTIRLGVFIVFTFAALATGVFLIGDRQFLFSSTYPLKATFKNVSGLNSGAEVRVGGIHKGTVRQIQLPASPDGEVTVVMSIEKSTRNVIRADSVASIETEGLLGSKFVDISFGSSDAPQAENGSAIPSAPTMDVSDLIKKTNGILDTTKETLANVKESSDQFREISTKVNHGEGSVGALVNDRKLYENLNQATSEAKLGASAFEENMEALKHNFFLRGFFNQRGYEDLAKFTENEISRLPTGTVLKSFSYDPKKLFENPDTAKLRNQKTLSEAGHFLEVNDFGTAVIIASGGLKGDANEIRELTQARAMVVRDYLVKNFAMDDTRLKTMGIGKTQTPSNDAGMIDIMVYAPEAAPTDNKSRH